jgi:ubiquinone/menaquinone biosynthesis C-methylase UbiE
MDGQMIDPMAWAYETVASVYEEHRPSYPPVAVARLVDELDIRAGTTVADVGAGTGKFTRLLVPTAASIIAIEPVSAMRRELHRALPDVAVVGGVARALPLADASLDALTVAQAFHWFADAETVSEFRRVLRPGRKLGLIWNRRDRSSPVWREIEAVIAPFRPERRRDWKVSLANAGFDSLDRAVFEWRYRSEPARIRSRVASMSWIAQLSDETRDGLLDDVQQIAMQFASDGLVDMTESTEVYWTRRL